jgi:hypothetical protein
MYTDYSFIPYLYNEDIYIIHPPRKTEVATFRGILFFVDYPGISTVPTKEKILLNKIMEAVRLQAVQVTIVNITEMKTHLSTRAVIRFENAKVIFFTGKSPGFLKNLEMNFKYSVVSQGNNEFVLADVLEMLDQDRNLKKNLWNVLQELFPNTKSGSENLS